MALELPLFAAVLAAQLIAISVIDICEQRIPDPLNLSLLVTGLGMQVGTNLEFVSYQILFAAGVGLLFLAVRQVHFSVTGVIGLGLGDVKMVGAGAMWFAPSMFPLFLFIASFAALGVALLRFTLGSPTSRFHRLAFGPFLAFGIALAFALENFWS
ncbi:MAG: prepilin peptidase [Mesorhizobium sp.]|uniref:prepilin peptidase n=1 Tax=Mesorhizobium sp. TaxID=1871066 RepID=UPI000FE925C1|nr:A24 family peptidase [Mesorhizobium sp.]RWM12881.1 MAG: prepilin peptidase [Mesorhizobium sp.]